jgi:hypothetical protein
MHRFLAAALASIVVSSALAQPEPTRAPPQPSWVEGALKFVPEGFVAGYVVRADGTIGILPIFPANADDPKTPGSAFDRGQVLVVQLRRSGEAVEAMSASVRPREPSDIDAPQDTASADLMKWFEDTNRALADKAAALPAGTVPCDLGAYSIDRDPKGLNVRAEPSVKAPVLGTLPPPFKVRMSDADGPKDGWRTEFTIVGFKDGWFLIEGAKPPGKEYEREGRPLKYPKVYAGRGWVAANKVGANFANGATRQGGLFQAPHVDARWIRITDHHGNELGADNSPDRVLACSGLWALVEKSGARGWWRHLCSKQVTNCS